MARVGLIVALLISMLAPLQQATPLALAQCAYTPGSVVSLSGTPHLFINDTTGVLLHWGGDTRALAGRTIAWNNTCTLGLDPLEATPRGDPWLSAGLPQVGEVIYQAKWEQDEAEPTLLRIRTIDDVELFGIGDNNYGTFVIQRPDWETRYGFPVGRLKVGPLASADSFAWSSTDQANYAQLLTNMQGVETAALFQATSAGIDAGLSLPAIADCEEAGLVSFDTARNPSTALAATQDCLTRLAFGPTPPAPSTPANLRVTATGDPNALRLDWTDTANNEAGFRVVRNGATIATLSANTTTFVDQAAPIGRVNCYTIVAFNNGGQSESAQVCTGVAVLVPPAAPSSLSFSVVPGGALRLDWADNSINEDGFRVTRDDQPIATLPANSTTYTDQGWSALVSSCYRVVAFNEAGIAATDQFCTGSVTIPTAGPATPTVVPTRTPTPIPVGPSQLPGM